MAFFVNEQKMVEENTFQYENRIKAPTNRLLDTTQTYTNFYHIDELESTTDAGFIDVASVIGNRSPLRFIKISDFPIYGLEQIVLQLQDTDQGIDTSYEGEAIILPGTIKPLQNDFFTIPVLKDSYVFRVTDIQYDNIMPDNYYKIEFKLEYIDEDKIEQIEDQVISDNICILENIGTSTSCIIEKSEFIQIQDIEKMYNEIISFYMAMFYNERHNVLLCPYEGYYLYDPFQTEFINNNSLLNDKNNLKCTILTDQYTDPKRKLKYNKSVYKFIESKDMKLLNTFGFTLRPGVTVHESSFHRWHDNSINILDIPIGITVKTAKVFSEDYMESIRYNADVDGEYATLIKKFVRDENLTIKDIPLSLSDELVYMNDSIEVFFFTPIIMYIIKEIIKKALKRA